MNCRLRSSSRALERYLTRLRAIAVLQRSLHCKTNPQTRFWLMQEWLHTSFQRADRSSPNGCKVGQCTRSGCEVWHGASLCWEVHMAAPHERPTTAAALHDTLGRGHNGLTRAERRQNRNCAHKGF